MLGLISYEISTLYGEICRGPISTLIHTWVRSWPGPTVATARPHDSYLSCPLSSTAGTTETFSTRPGVKLVMDRAEERAGPEDVGDQALMRGLVIAFPFVRPGLTQPGVGRRSCDRPRRQLGSSPCRGPALATARLCLAGCPVRGLKRRGCGPAEPS